MGFLSFLKGMKIEDNCPIDVTFRTSRTGKCFGSMLVVTGLGLGWHIYLGNPILCGFYCFLAPAILFTALFLFLGVLVLTYRKCVLISKLQSCIEYMESSLFKTRRATFRFDQVSHIELCSVGECLFQTEACLFVVKAYFRQEGVPHTFGVRLFESLDKTLAEDAAQTLSHIVRRPVVQQPALQLNPSFTSRVGI